MKLTKALYFIAFLLSVNLLAPGSNNYVEANPTNADEIPLPKKIKNNKVAIISTILATVALAVAGTTFGVMHLKNKGDSKKKPILSDMKRAPLFIPEKKTVPAPDNKATASNFVPHIIPPPVKYDPSIYDIVNHCSY
ncbi:early transcribed membrane protein [Plasmodium vinckei vinckei]|uniref:Early transcribed membrane protein n=1 Tax=Plasmodium vinckei vinckei TaxID=54757 RepID=A0A449BNA2_PLAVN|nr:early transcribed membrane protein [Plasmodium vinckei vinckei]VEV54910.1 early transcribed membrane protein [Plasmodium vinckei vinckei]